jgi:DNA-binding IclR family transcriptional regulator
MTGVTPIASFRRVPVAEDRMPVSLDVLWFLAHAPEPVTLAEIVSGTGHSRTTVDRTLARLCESGWVSQEGRPKRFTPGMRVALMGLTMLRLNRARELALRYARELAQTARHSVAISLYDDGDVIFTDMVELRGEHFVHDLGGVRLPAPIMASGKILLAYQPEEEVERVAQCTLSKLMPAGYSDADAFITEIRAFREQGDNPHAFLAEIRTCREHGYAFHAHQEQQTAGLAVPVLDQSGRAVYALSITLLLPVDEATVSRLVPVARLIALRATAELQNHPYRGHLIT